MELVFCVIIGVMWMKKPMWMAVIAASVATIFLYGLSPDVAVHGIIKGATARATVETLVVFYSITFLQRMMEKRKNLSNAQVAMNGLFNNNRVNASIVPFLLGMLPAASTVLICGPIVRESVKDSDLSVPEQACITSYFRHISEAFVPTYTSIFIALGITEGRVSAGTFILAMLPMAMEVITSGHTGLALFTLLMCIGYVAMQISPTHICLVLCSEDYKISLGSMIRKTTPMVALFTLIAIAYYGLLSMMGF